jgi:hypothetical protein
MLQPVGSLPPAVYWRRRILIIGTPLALILLTLYVGFGGGGKSNGESPKPTPHTSVPGTSTPGTSSGQGSSTSGQAGSKACALSALSVTAETAAKSFKVGQTAALYLVVANTGKSACTRDLSDSQIELIVYTGDVRVWGSRDCVTQPGTSVQSLAPNRPIRLEIQWSGKTSKPGCGGTRLQVQPGTYRLVAALSGKKSTAVTFTVTA